LAKNLGFTLSSLGAEQEPHNFGGAGAVSEGASGFGSHGSSSDDVQHVLVQNNLKESLKNFH
jgi:hypothetical protein